MLSSLITAILSSNSRVIVTDAHEKMAKENLYVIVYIVKDMLYIKGFLSGQFVIKENGLTFFFERDRVSTQISDQTLGKVVIKRDDEHQWSFDTDIYGHRFDVVRNGKIVSKCMIISYSSIFNFY